MTPRPTVAQSATTPQANDGRSPIDAQSANDAAGNWRCAGKIALSSARAKNSASLRRQIYRHVILILPRQPFKKHTVALPQTALRGAEPASA